MYRAMGTTFTIKTPFGNQNFDVPLDQIAVSAVNAAWPPLKAKIEAEVPIVIDKAWPPLQSKLEAEIPQLIKKAQPAIQTEKQSILKQVNKTAFYLGATLVAAIGLGVLFIRR